MKKTYWSGFLSGMMVTIICLFVITGVGNIFVNRSVKRQGIATQEVRDTNTAQEKISATKVLGKVSILENYIDTYYLNDVNGEKLEDGIFKGIVSGLEDPYSVYYTASEYASLQDSSSGVYCGIGAKVMQSMDTGIIVIVEPFEEGPAYEAGILPGDILYKLEGEEVTGQDLSEVVARMKGKEGTKVNLTIMRESEKTPDKAEEIEVAVTRRVVKTPTVKYEMLENQIGYIKVSEFDEVTAEQFRSALDDLEKQGEKSLIIDLRNNGGGRLTAVVDMLDRMLPEGTIVSIKQKSGEGETYTSTNDEKFDKPLMVLINGHSASASEVFAGAIQDYGIGKLVGTTSFGKGIVQTIFGLTDGTAVKLTTAEYFTPKGRNIHGTGLTPDIEVDLKEDLKKKVTVDKTEDNQLNRAIEEILK